MTVLSGSKEQFRPTYNLHQMSEIIHDVEIYIFYLPPEDGQLMIEISVEVLKQTVRCVGVNTHL